MFFYSFDDIDIERKQKEILDIKNQNAELKTHFEKCIKIYGIICILIFLIFLICFKEAILFITLFIFFMSIVTISIMYLFKFYNIKYICEEEKLLIKNWKGTLIIPKEKLKKVYIKEKYGPRSPGTNLYINYINKNNKEKYILLDILFLDIDEIKEFLDIFIV